MLSDKSKQEGKLSLKMSFFYQCEHILDFFPPSFLFSYFCGNTTSFQGLEN